MVSEPACDLCDGTGTMTWQQPVRALDGGLVLAQMGHPCVNGCSGWRKMPAVEQAGVVDADGTSSTPGNVTLASKDHRCDWFLPRPGGDTGASAAGDEEQRLGTGSTS